MRKPTVFLAVIATSICACGSRLPEAPTRARLAPVDSLLVRLDAKAEASAAQTPLPSTASEGFAVNDVTGGLSVHVQWLGASAAAAASHRGFTWYRDAL